jgi:hypothetical protein
VQAKLLQHDGGAFAGAGANLHDPRCYDSLDRKNSPSCWRTGVSANAQVSIGCGCFVNCDYKAIRASSKFRN